jgi:hypothetical protein
VNLKAMIYEFCECAYRPVGPTSNVFLIQLTTVKEAQTTVLWTRPQISLVPQTFLFIIGDMCGTSITADNRESDLEVFR